MRPSAPLLLAALLGAGCAKSHPPVSGTITGEDFASTIVGDTYRLLVRTPPGFDPSRRYPTVYQLDATNYGGEFDITAGFASDLEARGVIPPTLVVGLGYPYDNDLPDGKGRWRDYVTTASGGKPGGAPAFLRALAEELIPHVEAQLPVDATRRTLAGHSLGGFFTLYALLHANDAPLFTGYIAGDPSLGLDDGVLLGIEQQVRDAGRGLTGTLYLPIARYDGAVQRVYFDALSARLAAYPTLAFRGEVFDGDHGDLIGLTPEHGLPAIFATLGGAP